MSGNAVGVQSGPRELKTAQQQTRQHVTNVAGHVHSYFGSLTDSVESQALKRLQKGL